MYGFFGSFHINTEHKYVRRYLYIIYWISLFVRVYITCVLGTSHWNLTWPFPANDTECDRVIFGSFHINTEHKYFRRYVKFIHHRR